MSLSLQLADIATNERKKLSGFKVLGVFPFYLRYITTKTHIQLCKIKEQIQVLSDKDPSVNDFYNSELQENVTPLIIEYCTVALLNNRRGSFFFRYFLNRKLWKCGHSHLSNLYMTILGLNEPAFFLAYWNWIMKKDHTLLKEEEQ